MTGKPDTARSRTPYFAYGSNLDPGQMKRRCPGHCELGRARLVEWKLFFRGRSERWDGGAVATIESFPGAMVWGALFRLTDEDYRRLDTYEGFSGVGDPDNFYDQVTIVVLRPDGVSVEALTYRMRSDPPGLPSRRYLEKILAGAGHHGLPEEYIIELRGALGDS